MKKKTARNLRRAARREANSEDDDDSNEKASADAVKMDQRLYSVLFDLHVSNKELPMEIGYFYERFFLKAHCNVHESSFQTVRKWLTAMENQGQVLLKKQRASKRKAATLVVVAVGTQQVRNFRNRTPSNILPSRAQKEPTPPAVEHCDPDEEDDVSFQPTKHARKRQYQRDITNADIQKAFLQAKIRRRQRDGVKLMEGQNGISVLVGCGAKRKIITTWRQVDPDNYNYTDRWSSQHDSHTGSDDTKQQKQQELKFVTVSERFQRYDHDEKKVGKKNRYKASHWRKGSLVQKNGKFRKTLLVLGLEKRWIPKIVKELQNQEACHAVIGKLDYEEWMDLVGDEIDPLAPEGSPTLSFTLSEDPKKISRALEHVEKYVPRHCRRYVKEVENASSVASQTFPESSLDGEDWMIEDVRIQLEKLYLLHAPDKVKKIPDLMKKYKGREEKLLHAARKKYLRAPFTVTTGSEQDKQDPKKAGGGTPFTTGMSKARKADLSGLVKEVDAAANDDSITCTSTEYEEIASMMNL